MDQQIKSDKMKISVVITAFKKPDRLQKAINTVKNQTFKDYEIIVVDGSNSKELELIAKKENTIYLNVEPEYVNASFWKGIQHQRNIGCQYAKGEYIAMLDDDDEWEPTKLEKQIDVCNPLWKNIIGLVICYNKNIEGYGQEFIEEPKEEIVYTDLLKSFNLSSTSSYLIRRDVLMDIGWWDESLRGMHEYDIALKIAKKGYKIITVQEVLMKRYRSFNQERKYYFIKIAEVMDFWHHYGKDVMSYLSPKEIIMDAAKTLGLFMMYLMGYVIKDKVWRLLYPLKSMYDQGVGV